MTELIQIKTFDKIYIYSSFIISSILKVFPIDNLLGQRAPKVDKDKIPREITVKAGKPVEVDIPYIGTARQTAQLLNT